MSPKNDSAIVSLNEVKRFVFDCMITIGLIDDHAEAMSSIIAESDYRGCYGHGLNKLENVIREFQMRACDIKGKPRIIRQNMTTAWVDGKNALGAVVGRFCMELAMDKAKTAGIGWVVAKASNDFGVAGVYSTMASKRGLIGLVFSNSCPIMVPCRAKVSALGSNPISMTAPGVKGDYFHLDMATTVVGKGKVNVYKDLSKPVPVGWAMGDDGNEETDPNDIIRFGNLYPLGGKEETAGYKGQGLAMMVDIFTGVLGGGSSNGHIKHWAMKSEKANLGQCFVAIDPRQFAPGFEERLSDYLQSIRNLEPVDPEFPVIVPGDTVRRHMKRVDEAGGVRYSLTLIDNCNKLAKELRIRGLRLIKQ